MNNFAPIPCLLVLNFLLVVVQSFSNPPSSTLTFLVRDNGVLKNVYQQHSSPSTKWNQMHSLLQLQKMSTNDNQNDGVVELADDDDDEQDTQQKQDEANVATSTTAAPFLSQGEIEKEALELSNDPKQTRVIIYIIISLVPVLFLIPLMLGSRDLIPLDGLPPVELN